MADKDEYETPELKRARELAESEGITVAAAAERLRLSPKQAPKKANMAVPPGSTESI